jgi:hypothetical protein
MEGNQNPRWGEKFEARDLGRVWSEFMRSKNAKPDGRT